MSRVEDNRDDGGALLSQNLRGTVSRSVGDDDDMTPLSRVVEIAQIFQFRREVFFFVMRGDDDGTAWSNGLLQYGPFVQADVEPKKNCVAKICIRNADEAEPEGQLHCALLHGEVAIERLWGRQGD